MIFCRDRQGSVRALFNVCRHRGAIVCREREGNTRQFYCIYHGWTYNTDGSLKAIPGDDAYGPGFDKKTLGLVEVPRLDRLSRIMSRLESIRDVFNVVREVGSGAQAARA